MSPYQWQKTVLNRIYSVSCERALWNIYHKCPWASHRMASMQVEYNKQASISAFFFALGTDHLYQTTYQ